MKGLHTVTRTSKSLPLLCAALVMTVLCTGPVYSADSKLNAFPQSSTTLAPLSQDTTIKNSDGDGCPYADDTKGAAILSGNKPGPTETSIPSSGKVIVNPQQKLNAAQDAVSIKEHEPGTAPELPKKSELHRPTIALALGVVALVV
jgi:hypothetical protein